MSKNTLVERHLHIVCHDIPYPANYGGVIDCFFMIQALKAADIHIHLHCFEYGSRTRQPELDKFCASVHYYPRKKRFSPGLPYIVSSRSHPQLLRNLLGDNHPILMYGLHCSAPVLDKQFAGRKMLLRLLNVEADYYRGLAQSTRNWRKLYYLLESRLLRRYEARVVAKAPILTIGAEDCLFFRNLPGALNVDYLAAFVPYQEVAGPEGKGGFCLYHGNLSVPENEMAAAWLLQHVFGQMDTPFVIAGRNPSKKLIALAHEHLNTCIAANPSEREMQDLIAKAQINILPAFNATGVKLKVLESLYRGRFCITNDNARKGFHDDGLLIKANDAHSMQQAVNTWFDKPFTAHDIADRRQILSREFDNRQNAARLISYLW